MSNTGSFRNLKVWEKSHSLVLIIYKATYSFPREEIYGLSSQMRRAAVSIPANIAEGYKRTGHRDKIRFFNIAQASLEEVRYFLILASDLNYVIPKEASFLSEEISKMLEAYIHQMKQNYINEPDSEY